MYKFTSIKQKRYNQTLMQGSQEESNSVGDEASNSLRSQEHSRAQFVDSEQKVGKWSDKEHIMFIAYLQFHREDFKSKIKRRSSKFFKNMAQFIKTRSGLQCRSHHQKLIVKFHYINRIINDSKANYDADMIEHFRKELQTKTVEETRAKIQKKRELIQTTEIDVQTDMRGINMQIIPLEEYQRRMAAQPVVMSHTSIPSIPSYKTQLCKTQEEMRGPNNYHYFGKGH